MNVTDAVTAQAQGMAMNWVLGRNVGDIKFVHGNMQKGGVLNVLAKQALNTAASILSGMAMDAYKNLVGLNKGKDLKSMKQSSDYINLIDEQNEQNKKYGYFDTGNGIYFALDEAGEICDDALMLGIPVKTPIKLEQKTNMLGSDGYPGSKMIDGVPSSPKLVWYDTTAIISINSDRNLILTKVAGRDYSRKELVSNGDIEFSVSGVMSSGLPDVYPANEIKKFIQVMQYKGVIEVNNQFLDQFNISKIVIKNFNLPQKEGYKNLQHYTFTAVGIQPDNEVEVTEDTINIVNSAIVDMSETNPWTDLLNKKLDGLKNAGADIIGQGLSAGAGLLNNLL